MKLNRDKLEKTLDARLSDDLGEARISGAQVLVMQSGETLCKRTVGMQNILTKEPLREDAVFRLASMTKPVTGIAALKAVELGYFRLDDLVESHLPEFANRRVAELKDGRPVITHDAHQPLRIWHMLSHCSGLMAECPAGSALYQMTPKAAYASREAAVAYCAAQPLAFDPTEYTAYSGYGAFDVVARIIERKSGLSFEDFVQKNIFDPLGIKDLTFHPSEEQWGRMINMTDRVGGKESLYVEMGRHTFEAFPLTYATAGAGLVGTLDGYSVFAQMLQHRGSLNGVRIVSPGLFEELRKPRVPLSTPGRNPISSWGLGVRVVDQEDVLPVGSFGWSGAYGTHFWVDTENEITAIYLRNSRWYDSHGGGEIARRFEKDVMSCME